MMVSLLSAIRNIVLCFVSSPCGIAKGQVGDLLYVLTSLRVL